MEWLVDPQVWMALVTLSALEIVLGIDNIIFIWYTLLGGGQFTTEEAQNERHQNSADYKTCSKHRLRVLCMQS